VTLLQGRHWELLDRDGRPGLARGAVVVICSDGLEVGDADVLAAQMERLHRLAHASSG